MNFNNVVWKSIIGAGLVLAGSAASAALIVTEGVDNTGTDNVIANACTDPQVGPALTIQGCLNTDHDLYVNFTSDENIQFDAGGQARIEAEVGEFSYLKIELADPDYSFEKLVLNINATEMGTVLFNSSPGGFSQPFALVAGGQNFFTLTGETFSWISFMTTVAIESVDLVSDVRQVRIGVTPVGVPEPGTLSMFGLALLGIGFASRRHQQSHQ